MVRGSLRTRVPSTVTGSAGSVPKMRTICAPARTQNTGQRARDGLGYSSEREFDFTPFEAMRPQFLELGRACIHQRHRNFAVLNLLCKGIASYAPEHGARHLVGCSSLTSTDAAEGAAACALLARQLAPQSWRTTPMPAFGCPLDAASLAVPRRGRFTG